MMNLPPVNLDKQKFRDHDRIVGVFTHLQASDAPATSQDLQCIVMLFCPSGV
jgi:hypothetical protein